MAGLYFDEFHVDQTFEHPWGRTAGIAEFGHVAVNQHLQVVATCVRQTLMHKRSALPMPQWCRRQ